MGREAGYSKDPDMLRELWQALGNDPQKIAECMALPLLAERELRSGYAYDERFHGELKERVRNEVAGGVTVWGMKGLSGKYEEVELRKKSSPEGKELEKDKGGVVELSEAEWNQETRRLAGLLGAEGRNAPELPPGLKGAGAHDGTPGISSPGLPAGGVSRMQEDEEKFSVIGVLESGPDYVKVATVVWQKVSFGEWWGGVRGQFAPEVKGKGYTYTLPNITAVATPSDTWLSMSLISLAELITRRCGQGRGWLYGGGI